MSHSNCDQEDRRRLAFRFSLWQLFVVMTVTPVSLVVSQGLATAMMPVNRWSYVTEGLRRDIGLLTKIHVDFDTDSKRDVDSLNAWLRGASIRYGELEHPGTDPWGNPYQCVATPKGPNDERVPYGHVLEWGEPFLWPSNGIADGDTAENACFGFFAFGEDGITNSNGNDPDDLNSWDFKSGRFYRDRRAQHQRDEHNLKTAQIFCILFAMSCCLACVANRNKRSVV